MSSLPAKGVSIAGAGLQSALNEPVHFATSKRKLPQRHRLVECICRQHCFGFKSKFTGNPELHSHQRMIDGCQASFNCISSAISKDHVILTALGGEGKQTATTVLQGRNALLNQLATEVQVHHPMTQTHPDPSQGPTHPFGTTKSHGSMEETTMTFNNTCHVCASCVTCVAGASG